MIKYGKQKVLEGYKVVLIRDNTRISAVMYLHGAQVLYGEFWTQPEPGCGPLAVFRRLVDALRFTSTSGAVPCAIYRCWYTRSKHIGLWRSKSLIEMLNVPQGTDFADAVYLGGRVA